jgi:hypothetical protein
MYIERGSATALYRWQLFGVHLMTIISLEVFVQEPYGLRDKRLGSDHVSQPSEHLLILSRGQIFYAFTIGRQCFECAIDMLKRFVQFIDANTLRLLRSFHCL